MPKSKKQKDQDRTDDFARIYQKLQKELGRKPTLAEVHKYYNDMWK